MKTTILILGVLASGHISAQCSSSGPGQSTSLSDNNNIGIYDWGTPAKAQESDDMYSIASVNLVSFSEASTHYLMATGFKFSIPANASICGIEVKVEKHYQHTSGTLSSIADKSVRLIRNGSFAGADRATAVAWSTEDAESSYGNISDNWGLFLTASDINSASFGVAISAVITSGSSDLSLYAMIDQVSITVYYNMLLPVNFKDIRGIREQDHIALSWVTASESNSSHFVVEKTINDKWTAIDSIAAAGNSAEHRNYRFIDRSPVSTNIYRIRQVDRDGHFIFSKTVRVHFSSGANIIIKSYPNPAQKILTIESSAPFRWTELTDQAGKVVLHKETDTAVYTTMINIAALPAGIYMLRTDKSAKEAAKRVVIYR